VIVVKKIVIGIVLSMATTNLVAQSSAVKPRISVIFAIDGETVLCENLKVELRLDHRLIPVKMSDHGFIIPELFKQLYDSPQSCEKNNIDIRINCGEYMVEFPGECPVRVSPGVWKAGISYPPFRYDYGTGSTNLFEQGMWLSYVDWDSDGCEPCVVSTISHPDIPVNVVDRLRREQPVASGERARDVAYALAVFKVEYDRNRNYLLNLLDQCLSLPIKTPNGDLCDSNLGDYLINLYWRGDGALLQRLLQMADSQSKAVDNDSYFYSEMLEQRTAVFLQGLDGLPFDKQKVICKLAGDDDLSMNFPKEERVLKQLKAIGGNPATRCIQEIEKTDNWRLKK
jgi:hypothetical protein